jgi:pyruvate ferredoxin oxidoreductase beta subunit
MSEGMLVRRNNNAGGKLMDKFTLFASQLLTFKEYFSKKGHNACSGCGVALAVRHVYKALDKANINIGEAKWEIPFDQTLPINSDKANQPDTKTALLTVSKESKDCLHICFDNECPDNKLKNTSLIKKNPDISAASGYTYVATASPSHPFDLFEKVIRGSETQGNAYIHILCPCPVGWGFNPKDTVRIARIAVESRLFPLYEIAHGYYQITIDEPNHRPVKDYIKRQDRFSGWKAKQIEALQEEVDGTYYKLNEKIKSAI